MYLKKNHVKNIHKETKPQNCIHPTVPFRNSSTPIMIYAGNQGVDFVCNLLGSLKDLERVMLVKSYEVVASFEDVSASIMTISYSLRIGFAQ